ncbi:MAG TPA: hypothetical protein PLK99_08765, partial [Burkholderiales bacterium]|nr:hypothetical protein [Burkholderiales bacterium]
RVTPSPSETVDVSCVSLDHNQIDDGIFQLKHAKIEILDSGRLVSIATSQSINEPIVNLKLDIHCSNSGEVGKLFTVFLDPASISPPLVQQPERISAPSTPAERKPPAKAQHEAVRAAGGTITVRPHDTLSGLAHDYFPDDKVARRRFIAAVLAENPGLSLDLIRSGSKLNIPDLKSIGSPADQKAPVRKPLEAKPAFHLDIVSGEAKPSQDLKQTETQLITRADDQAVQMLQLKSQITSLEGKLTELQHRVAEANRLLARMNLATPRQQAPAIQIPNLIWIAVLAAMMVAGGIVYWYFRRKNKERGDLLDEYINPTLSKPALMDHLDYFESDTPDHHKW